MKTHKSRQAPAAGPLLGSTPPGRRGQWSGGAGLAGWCATVLILCAAWPAPAGMQAFLSLTGIPGEVTETNHQGWIEVWSFSEGQVRSLLDNNSQFSDLVLTKPVDKATPLLMLACARADPLATVRLQLLTVGQTSAVFYDLQLTNVTITAESQATAANSAPVETIALRFDYISWTYTILAGNGLPPGTVQAYWDLLHNLGGSAESQTALDAGLRAYDGTSKVRIGLEPGTTTSPFRIHKNGTNYGVVLVVTNDASASRFRIQTTSGTRALMKLP